MFEDYCSILLLSYSVSTILHDNITPSIIIITTHLSIPKSKSINTGAIVHSCKDCAHVLPSRGRHGELHDCDRLLQHRWPQGGGKKGGEEGRGKQNDSQNGTA